MNSRRGQERHTMVRFLLIFLLLGWLTATVSAQEILWTRQFGSTKTESANAVAVDSAGNVYAAGWTQGALSGQTSAGDEDAFVRKYDGEGNELWTRQFGSAKNEVANGVTVDSAGNNSNDNSWPGRFG